MRKRATAVIFKDGNVLLVRDKRRSHYSLPGGGIRKHEPVLSACIREIHEELGVDVVKIHRVLNSDFEGSVNKHHVCIVEYQGEPKLNDGELAEIFWWNCKDEIRLYGHVGHIVRSLL